MIVTLMFRKTKPVQCGLERKKERKESEVAQSCLSLCDPMDGSLPGYSIHGIFQARILEWVEKEFQISFLQKFFTPFLALSNGIAALSA